MITPFGRSTLVEAGLTLSALAMPAIQAPAQHGNAVKGPAVREDRTSPFVSSSKDLSQEPALKIARIVCDELRKSGAVGAQTRSLPMPLKLEEGEAPEITTRESSIRFFAEIGRQGLVIWALPPLKDGEKGVYSASFSHDYCRLIRSSFDPLSDAHLKNLSVAYGEREVESEDGLGVLGIGFENEVGFELKGLLTEGGASDVKHHVAWAVIDGQAEQRIGAPQRLELVDVPRVSGQFVVKSTLSWSAAPQANARHQVTFIYTSYIDPLTGPLWLDPRPVAKVLEQMIEKRSSFARDRVVEAALPGISNLGPALEPLMIDLLAGQVIDRGRDGAMLSSEEMQRFLAQALKSWAYGLTRADLDVVSGYLEKELANSVSQDLATFEKARVQREQWKTLLKDTENRAAGFRDIVVTWQEIPFSLPWLDIVEALLIARLSR